MSATVGSDKLPLCILNYFIIFKNSQGGQENKVGLRNRENTYKATVKWQTLSLK